MTVKDFVDLYNRVSDENFVKKHIVCTYLSFSKKCNLCERIIKATYYTTSKYGVEKFHVDSTAKHMLFNLSIIDMYTDVDVNLDNSINEYDLLQESGLFKIVKDYIGDIELSELLNILEMKERDVICNEYEPHAFISGQVERFGALLGISFSPILEKFADIIENLDVEKVGNILNKLDKESNNKLTKLFK